MNPELATAISGLASVFMRRLDDEQIEKLGDTLADLPLDLVIAACDEIARHEPFFPRPVVIRSYVDRLQRQRTQHTSPAAAFVDPNTGEQAIWRCLACQDTGWRPYTEKGHVISWDQELGIGAYLGAPRVKAHHVERCTLCNRLAAPKAKITKPTYDDQHSDRRGKWSRYDA